MDAGSPCPEDGDFFYARPDAEDTEEAINKFLEGLESQVGTYILVRYGNLDVASSARVVCQLKRLVPRRRQLRRRGSCAEQRLAGVARLIGNDGK